MENIFKTLTLLYSGNQTFHNLSAPPQRINIYYSQSPHGHVRLYMEKKDTTQSMPKTA